STSSSWQILMKRSPALTSSTCPSCLTRVSTVWPRALLLTRARKALTTPSSTSASSRLRRTSRRAASMLRSSSSVSPARRLRAWRNPLVMVSNMTKRPGRRRPAPRRAQRYSIGKGVRPIVQPGPSAACSTAQRQLQRGHLPAALGHGLARLVEALLGRFERAEQARFGCGARLAVRLHGRLHLADLHLRVVHQSE